MKPLRSLLALGALLSGPALAGCLSPLELANGSQVELAVTDPTLVEELESLIAVMYFNPVAQNPAGEDAAGPNACADLVDDDLPGLRAREPRASQAFSAHPEEGAPASHAFGNVGASGRYSFLLLGSVRPAAELGRAPLENAAGSVIAVGCEELTVRQNHRYDLPLTLLPAGLR